MFAVDGVEEGGLPQCSIYKSINTADPEAMVLSGKSVLDWKSIQVAIVVAVGKDGQKRFSSLGKEKSSEKIRRSCVGSIQRYRV